MWRSWWALHPTLSPASGSVVSLLCTSLWYIWLGYIDTDLDSRILNAVKTPVVWLFFSPCMTSFDAIPRFGVCFPSLPEIDALPSKSLVSTLPHTSCHCAPLQSQSRQINLHRNLPVHSWSCSSVLQMTKNKWKRWEEWSCLEYCVSEIFYLEGSGFSATFIVDDSIPMS